MGNIKGYGSVVVLLAKRYDKCAIKLYFEYVNVIICIFIRAGFQVFLALNDFLSTLFCSDKVSIMPE